MLPLWRLPMQAAPPWQHMLISQRQQQQHTMGPHMAPASAQVGAARAFAWQRWPLTACTGHGRFVAVSACQAVAQHCTPAVCLHCALCPLLAAWTPGGTSTKFSNGVVAAVLFIPLVIT